MTSMQLLIGGAVVVALLAIPVAASTQPSLTQAQQTEIGKALAQRNCGMCHSTGSNGSSPNPEAPPFRSLHQRLDVDRLSASLARGIITRHPAMPEFRFDAGEVDAIVKYLKSVQDVSKA